MPDSFQPPAPGYETLPDHGIADRLIVALDVPTIDEARDLVNELSGTVFAFKIGFRLWPAAGADDLIEKMLREGKRVFLDAKLYDIPNTIEAAVRTAADRGLSFITVHHNEQVVKAAVKGRGNSDIKIFVVTLLTFLDDENLKDMGITSREVIDWKTQRALEFGCDGVIASPDDDLPRLKQIAADKGKSLLIATPAVRPEGTSSDDHARFGTPRQAIKAGADYLIVGRPIYNADDRRAAAQAIIKEMQEAAREMELAAAS